jgi:hypothetical protein
LGEGVTTPLRKVQPSYEILHGTSDSVRLFGALWKCGDGLFVEVPPLARDAFLTTLHPFLENVLQTVDHFEISRLGAPFHGWKSPEVARVEIWTVWRMF